MSTSDYLAYVVVASGYISKQFSKEKLPDLAMFLEADTFWKSQISQIYVDKSGKVDLYGRVGEDQVIHFGSTDSMVVQLIIPESVKNGIVEYETTEIFDEYFNKRLVELRTEKGLSQKDAAADLGVSQALLSHYEKGIRNSFACYFGTG